MAMIFLFHCFPDRLLEGYALAGNLKQSLWLGVNLFFVLSGFLITGILLRLSNTPRRYRTFYGRRALRIFPLYYLGLLIAFGLLPLLPFMVVETDNLVALPWFLLYSFNLVVANAGWQGSDLLNPFWSLCVEEQFYLVWPLFIFASLKAKRISLALKVVVLLSVLAKFALYAANFRWETIYLLTVSHVDSLGLGACAAYCHLKFAGRLVKPAAQGLLLSSLVLFGLFVYREGFSILSPWSHAFVPPLFAVATASLIYLIVTDALPKAVGGLLETRLLVELGKYSYGIYVYHWLIYKCFLNANVFGQSAASQILNFLVVVASTVVVSVLSYVLFESQFLKAKRHFFPSA